MNLEEALRALPVAFPEQPDLAPRVLARIERPSRRRWWLVAALAALAAAGALLAIPQTRAAILDLLRVGGVEVERVDTQPRAPVRPPALGREVPFAVAQRAVDFPLLAPSSSVAYLDGSIVNLRWKRYVLSQWRGEQLAYAMKQVGPGSRTVGVSVRGATGLWITGARHEIFYRDPTTGEVVATSRRLVGNVLIWEAGGITYRLEGARTLADARAVAGNLRRG
jgi:hypothetical protein